MLAILTGRAGTEVGVSRSNTRLAFAVRRIEPSVSGFSARFAREFVIADGSSASLASSFSFVEVIFSFTRGASLLVFGHCTGTGRTLMVSGVEVVDATTGCA